MDSNAMIWSEPGADAFQSTRSLSIDDDPARRRWRPGDNILRHLGVWARQAIVRRPRRSLVVLGTPATLEKVQAGLTFIDSDPPPLAMPLTVDRPIASLIGQIRNLIAISGIRELVVALPLPEGCCAETMVGSAIDLGATVSLVDSESFDTRPKSARPAEIAMKVMIDRMGAALLLMLLAPILLTTALLIRLTSPGPALFVQPRLGRNSSVIPVIKFRTMYVDQGDWWGGRRTVPGDPRVTLVGRWLRRWSIDELPQLLNVLAGHMSLVGPRPHAVMMKAGERLYFEAVPGYLARHRVKPGITGWAQVNRLSGEVDSVAAGETRLGHDLHYIDNWSIWLDLKIVWKTIGLFFDRVNRY